MEKRSANFRNGEADTRVTGATARERTVKRGDRSETSHPLARDLAIRSAASGRGSAARATWRAPGLKNGSHTPCVIGATRSAATTARPAATYAAPGGSQGDRSR